MGYVRLNFLTWVKNSDPDLVCKKGFFFQNGYDVYVYFIRAILGFYSISSSEVKSFLKKIVSLKLLL